LDLTETLPLGVFSCLSVFPQLEFVCTSEGLLVDVGLSGFSSIHSH
jgi:hypothetical protein